MDVLTLSRLQFALTIAFHYIYPPMSIGLGLLIVIYGLKSLRSKNPIWSQVERFWVKIFALTFSMGVASGIVQEFQFGTNWSTYSRFVGDVFGSALAAEGVFAFFLESGFLALLLFGFDRIGPRLHFFSALMVCLGAHFSAIWIVLANSWMQTPTGYQLVETTFGLRAQMTNFWAVLDNPSFPIRLVHTILAAWLTGAFLVLSVSAWYMLKKQHQEFARASMQMALIVAFIAGLLQFFVGDLSARIVAEYQPTKLAAEEGHWPASAPAPLYIIGWVDVESEKTYGIAIPGGTSFLLYGDPKAPVTGLKAFSSEDRPPLQVPFQSFHWMVAIYFSLITLVFLAVFQFWRKRLFTSRWVLWLLVFAVAGPMIANQLGWGTAEVGRQPWLVYNLLRTKDAFSPNLSAGQVTSSIVMFTVIYALLLLLFLFLLNEKIQHGPGPEDQPGPTTGLPDTLREIIGRKRA